MTSPIYVKYCCCLCTAQHTYEFKKENDQTVTEDVVTDVKDNYVQYHLEDDDSEIWVINDFNRVSTLVQTGMLCDISKLSALCPLIADGSIRLSE